MSFRRLTLAAGCVLTLTACASSGAAPVTTQAPAPVVAAPTRPRPYPVTEPVPFRRAVDAGTRTRTGEPGPKYWQQWSRYNLAAEYEPTTGKLTGTGTVTYFNRSPRPLGVVQVHLYDNLFSNEAVRVEAVPLTGGVTVTQVTVNGTEMPKAGGGQRGYRINGTIMSIPMPAPIAPGDSTTLGFAWSLTVPPEGAPRGGRTDELAYISYWYPQVAVYDDINGWQVDQYMGNAEFYMGYGDYDVAFTVPAGYLVGATGTLMNGGEVLSKQTQERLARARTTDSVVRVVTEADRGAGKATAAGGKLTWRFQARNVRDVAWGVSDKYAWDATRAVVGDRDGNGSVDTAAIYTFYVPGVPNSKWAEDARYARHSIEFLSNYLWPYPYPHMTAMQGPRSCGGMEYPMMTCLGGTQPDSFSLYGVTVHEIAHMWYPMQVGSDEKRHAWQDEGLTEFNGTQGENDFFPNRDAEAQDLQIYKQVAMSGMEEPLMRHGDRYDTGTGYGIASYMKPTTILITLRGMLGEEQFLKAYRAYGRRWLYKHPTPTDFFNTWENVTGQDLDWFWRTWFWETWTLDQAVKTVTPEAGGTTIVIEDLGFTPMPSTVKVTRADSSSSTQQVPVNHWLAGNTTYSFTVGAGSPVARVQIDSDGYLPDVNLKNNVWVAP
jgi:hypothetical protein